MTTCVPLYSPLQTSVSPPDATGVSPRFSSPTESTAEGGSRSVTLHTFPKAVTNLVVCESTVGYAYAEVIEGRF